MNTNNQYTIMSGGYRRLQINSRCNQFVGIMRDCSGSMRGDKAREASEATLNLCQELASPVNKDGFWLTCVDFSDSANLVHPLEKAASLVAHLSPLKVGFVAGSTNITSGLELCGTVLSDSLAKPNAEGIRSLRPVAILLSDGVHNKGADPIPAATNLKQIADVVCVAFGADADETMLRNIATSDQHFVRCTSGRELRAFLAQVGLTLTRTMAARTNAGQALAKISQ
jgi:uncharacterized protein YegL